MKINGLGTQGDSPQGGAQREGARGLLLAIGAVPKNSADNYRIVE